MTTSDLRHKRSLSTSQRQFLDSVLAISWRWTFKIDWCFFAHSLFLSILYKNFPSKNRNKIQEFQDLGKLSRFSMFSCNANEILRSWKAISKLHHSYHVQNYYFGTSLKNTIFSAIPVLFPHCFRIFEFREEESVTSESKKNWLLLL